MEEGKYPKCPYCGYEFDDEITINFETFSKAIQGEICDEGFECYIYREELECCDNVCPIWEEFLERLRKKKGV